MKNGDYILIKAPDDYIGKKYRNKYCYEHVYIYWLNTGHVPKTGEVIHHINENKHDNRFENLELKTASEHSKEHARPRTIVRYICEFCKQAFFKAKRGNKPRFCSRECNGRFGFNSKVGKGEVPHGTNSGYRYHKCRCLACKEANSTSIKKWKEKRKKKINNLT